MVKSTGNSTLLIMNMEKNFHELTREYIPICAILTTKVLNLSYTQERKYYGTPITYIGKRNHLRITQWLSL